MEFKKFFDCQHCEKDSCKDCIINLISLFGDTVNDCIIPHDFEKVVYANECICSMIGLKDDECIREYLFDISPGGKRGLPGDKMEEIKVRG